MELREHVRPGSHDAVALAPATARRERKGREGK
jgi:hypothetical protein